MMDVIILAGGLGTRLRSAVSDVPKCLAPINGRPFLGYLLDYLERSNLVRRVVLSVGYKREMIRDWIGEMEMKYSFQFVWSVEEEPLGTGGGIRKALSEVKTPDVLILNGDTFFDVDLHELHRRHQEGSKALTLALKPMRDFDRYGSVELDPNTGTILAFNEKAYRKEGMINGGVYVMKVDAPIFGGLPERFSFEKAVLEPQCQRKQLLGVVQEGYFIDIGVPEDYLRAQQELPRLF